MRFGTPFHDLPWSSAHEVSDAFGKADQTKPYKANVQKDWGLCMALIPLNTKVYWIPLDTWCILAWQSRTTVKCHRSCWLMIVCRSTVPVNGKGFAEPLPSGHGICTDSLDHFFDLRLEALGQRRGARVRSYSGKVDAGNKDVFCGR